MKYLNEKIMQRFAMITLVLIIIGAISIACFLIGYHKITPLSRIYTNYKTYITGEGDYHTNSLTERLKHDFGISPERFLIEPQLSFTRQYNEIELPNQSEKRANPLIYNKNPKEGYYAMLGAFDSTENFFNAILIDAKTSKVIHNWPLHLPNNTSSAHGFAVHGFAVLNDGSIVYNTDGLSVLKNISWCGDLNWDNSIGAHHSIALEEDKKYLWTFDGNDFIQVETKTGEINHKLTFLEIIRKNPDIDILGIKQNDKLLRKPNEDIAKFIAQNWGGDPIHYNDVEPFPESFTNAYGGQFNKNDLLVSARSINLVYVVNSQTGKIKWWNFGNVRRQHDPDWLATGKIRVYDNNRHRNVSKIIDIDPKTNKVNVVYHGEKDNFYSEIRGVSQTYDNNLLITIPDQGRVIDVDLNSDNEVTFEFINRYEGENQDMRNLVIMSAMYLPKDYFGDNLISCK